MSLIETKRLFLVGFTALVLSGLAATGASAQASNVYITPDGGGSGICTSNVHNPSWFNNSGNWGSSGSQIGAGTIVHLCGTFGTNLTAQGSGQVNNPVTILFESGAKFSAAAFVGTYIVLDGQSNIVVDGGSGGIIENTANGSHLGNKVYTDAIRAISSSNIEVKNLHIQNLYVHNDVADDALDGSTFNCFLSILAERFQFTTM
jgi:pectate lyase